jgi:hypothetical protein
LAIPVLPVEAFAWNGDVELACGGSIKEHERRGELKMTPYSSDYLLRLYAYASPQLDNKDSRFYRVKCRPGPPGEFSLDGNDKVVLRSPIERV